MTDSMIERVAAAIKDPWNKSLCSDAVCLAIARAAIGAMREPTEAMDAACRAESGADWPTGKNAYRAMIDEALK